MTREGTPVLVLGSYAFGARRPWWRFWEGLGRGFVVVTVTERRPWWRFW